MRRALAWLLIIAGILLGGAGVRILYRGYRAQSDAANDWQSRRAAPPPVLQPGDLIGQVRIPRLQAEWFLFEGSGQSVLERGPGHLEGTATPGSPGNCVIAGHRDTHFRRLKDIRDGDEILVESNGQIYRYRVIDKRVVYPTNTKMLQPEPDARLTLVTCFPFSYIGPAPKRFVVQAELVGQEPNSAGGITFAPAARTPASTPG